MSKVENIYLSIFVLVSALIGRALGTRLGDSLAGLISGALSAATLGSIWIVATRLPSNFGEIKMGDFSWLTGVGALVASGVALWGQWYSNKRQDERQSQLLASGSVEKKIEREVQLRKEIYMDLAAAVGKIQDYYSQMASEAAVGEQLTPKMQGVSEAFLRASLVAKNDVALAMGQLQVVHARNISSLTTVAINLTRLEVDKRIVTELFEESKKERNPEENGVTGRECLQRQGEKIEGELERIEVALFNSRMSVLEAAMQASGNLIEPWANLIGCIREELGIQFEEIEFQHAYVKKQQEIVTQMLSSLRSQKQSLVEELAAS